MNSLSVIHINARPVGGAWKVASRLTQLQKNAGMKSSLISLVDESHLKGITPIRILSKLDFEIQRTQETMTTTSFFSGISLSRIVEHSLKSHESDSVIHLHWIPGLMTKSVLKILEDKKVVWTLHDMRLLTGYCHHSGNCTRYLESCRECPQAPDILGKIIESQFMKTAHQLENVCNLKLVSPSNWLADLASKSLATKNLPIHIIRNPIPEDVFNLKLRHQSKKASPNIINVCIYGQNVPAKGGGRAMELLTKIQNLTQLNINVFVLGAKHNTTSNIRQLEVPYINDDKKFAEFLSKIDVLIHLSDAENSPYLVREAQACGVFVITEDKGGTKELLFDPNNSTLQIHDTGRLAEILNVLMDENARSSSNRFKELSTPAQFQSSYILKEYTKLYQE